MVTILLKGKKFIVKGLKEAERLLEYGGKIIKTPKNKTAIWEALSCPQTLFFCFFCFLQWFWLCFFGFVWFYIV